jgi:hypothetical protein
MISLYPSVRQCLSGRFSGPKKTDGKGELPDKVNAQEVNPEEMHNSLYIAQKPA